MRDAMCAPRRPRACLLLLGLVLSVAPGANAETVWLCNPSVVAALREPVEASGRADPSARPPAPRACDHGVIVTVAEVARQLLPSLLSTSAS